MTTLGWAPQIPDQWDVVPLNFVAKMGTGHTPDRSKPEYWENCTTPWITLTDASRHGQSLDPLMETYQQISPLGMRNSAAVLHPAGTVVLSRTASVGHSAIMGRPMATSQDFATWTCGLRLDPRYLLLVLRAMKPEWERLAFGSTHRTIYMPDLEALRIPLPPPDEQRRIACFLDVEIGRLETIRAGRLSQLQLIVERIKVSIDRLFGGRNLSDLRVKHLLRSKPRYGVLVPEFVDGEVPFVRVNDLNGLADKIVGLRTIPASLSRQYSTTILRRGDILVSVVGTLGRSVVVPSPLAGANVNRAIAVLRVRNGVSPGLLSAWMRTTMFETQAMLATASDSAQRTLGMEDLGNFSLSWPGDSQEQHRMEASLADQQAQYLELQAALERQIIALDERRRVLIAAAVTGQIDVTTARGADV